jgi:hypothetical protein
MLEARAPPLIGNVEADGSAALAEAISGIYNSKITLL